MFFEKPVIFVPALDDKLELIHVNNSLIVYPQLDNKPGGIHLVVSATSDELPKGTDDGCYIGFHHIDIGPRGSAIG